MNKFPIKYPESFEVRSLEIGDIKINVQETLHLPGCLEKLLTNGSLDIRIVKDDPLEVPLSALTDHAEDGVQLLSCESRLIKTNLLQPLDGSQEKF